LVEKRLREFIAMARYVCNVYAVIDVARSFVARTKPIEASSIDEAESRVREAFEYLSRFTLYRAIFGLYGKIEVECREEGG